MTTKTDIALFLRQIADDVERGELIAVSVVYCDGAGAEEHVGAHAWIDSDVYPYIGASKFADQMVEHFKRACIES